ncbi:MAG: hypothetical protein K1X88_02555 [Nannocystaceae bacterium]|nr:hypothetical protein [Nannocystaceae bacterium]
MRTAVAIAAVAVGACGVPVDIGALEGGADGSTSVAASGSGSSSSAGSSSGMIASGSSETGEVMATQHLAIRVGDLPSGSSTGTGSGGSSVGGDSTAGDTNDDPDTLQLLSGNYPLQCDDPYGAMPGCDAWQLGFRLPPELQVVGATGSVFDHYGGYSEAGEGVEGCSFGGGSLAGSFEITAIDDDHVAGRLTDLVGPTGLLTLEFDAPRCP